MVGEDVEGDGLRAVHRAALLAMVGRVGGEAEQMSLMRAVAKRGSRVYRCAVLVIGIAGGGSTTDRARCYDELVDLSNGGPEPARGTTMSNVAAFCVIGVESLFACNMRRRLDVTGLYALAKRGYSNAQFALAWCAMHRGAPWCIELCRLDKIRSHREILRVDAANDWLIAAAAQGHPLAQHTLACHILSKCITLRMLRVVANDNAQPDEDASIHVSEATAACLLDLAETESELAPLVTISRREFVSLGLCRTLGAAGWV